MPTTRPRYTLTDTGHLRELLDAAHARWPEIGDRKQLLLKLAEEGHKALELGDRELQSEERRERAHVALMRIRSLVDADLLLSDQAWT
ncbi:MAG: hypothetical protein ACRDL0_06620 [Thermoleophilaceae bacterium]